MSRPTRILQKRFVVFCEGDTEYNYIDRMRKNQGVQLVLKPINMHGGGYSNFKNWVKYQDERDEGSILKKGLKKFTESELKEKALRYFEVVPIELIKLADKVDKRRNDINHFGFSTKKTKSDAFKNSLKDYYEGFLKVIDMWDNNTSEERGEK